MKGRAARIDFRGAIEHRHEADDLIPKPGEAALVHRGVDRSLVMACPDGCGEPLTINLDRRSGPAWRFYRDAAAISMYPSVWRTTGCKSHFGPLGLAFRPSWHHRRAQPVPAARQSPGDRTRRHPAALRLQRLSKRGCLERHRRPRHGRHLAQQVATRPGRARCRRGHGFAETQRRLCLGAIQPCTARQAGRHLLRDRGTWR